MLNAKKGAFVVFWVACKWLFRSEGVQERDIIQGKAMGRGQYLFAHFDDNCEFGARCCAPYQLLNESLVLLSN